MTARKTLQLNRKAWPALLAYACCILFVTLIYRESGLMTQPQPVPFWSLKVWIEGSADTGYAFVLNILLFVPFGYLLSSLLGGRKVLPILFNLACSLLVETLQYLTNRGVFDADDLITNTLGGAIGVLIWHGFRKLGGVQLADAAWIRCALILVGIAGCLLNVKMTNDSVGTVYERQFAFRIDELRREGGELVFSGECYVHTGKTPPYTLFLQNDSGEIPAETGTSGSRFTAKANAGADSKYEVFVAFSRHAPIGTGVYIDGDRLEYVPGDLPETPSFLPETAVLKAVNEEYGVLIWQDGRTLYWVISGEIPPETELTCHLSTNEPDKLPEARRASRFDNLSFMADEAGERELKGYDSCRVFSVVLPDSYPVTSVMVGYSMGGRVIWEADFRP